MASRRRKAKITMSLEQAIDQVEASLETLEGFARGLRGSLRPETYEAFRIVIRAARNGGEDR